MEELTSLTQDIQNGIAYAKAFVHLREKRIAVLEERLLKKEEELELWKMIASKLAVDLARQVNINNLPQPE